MNLVKLIIILVIFILIPLFLLLFITKGVEGVLIGLFFVAIAAVVEFSENILNYIHMRYFQKWLG
ncbi:MAG: hypothetical protein ABIH52_00965 [Candidatus Aenigmatarchaeota archaeon]